MFFVDAIFALILAVLLGLFLTAVVGMRGPWAGPWALFVVLFLLIWAGGVWLTPIGPPVYGVYWLPFLLIGLLVVLLLAAGSEPRARTRREAVAEARAAEVGLSVFFWVLIAALLAAILLRYV